MTKTTIQNQTHPLLSSARENAAKYLVPTPDQATNITPETRRLSGKLSIRFTIKMEIENIVQNQAHLIQLSIHGLCPQPQFIVVLF